MKKIIAIITLLVAVCGSGMAGDNNKYVLVGPTKYFGTEWDITNAGNRMTKDGTNVYLMKKVTTTVANEQIPFLVYWDGVLEYINYTSNRVDEWYEEPKAVVNIPTPGTYYLFFSLTHNSAGSLQVMVIAAGSADASGNNLWTGGNMIYGESDGLYHLNREVEITDYTTQKGTFQVTTYIQNKNHSTNYGSGTYGTDNNVTFSENGSYELDLKFNPLTKAISYDSQRYIAWEMGTNRSCTFSSDVDLIVPINLTAYYITGYSGSELTLTKTRVIPATTSTQTAHTGVLLEGNPGTFKFYPTTGVSVNTTNILYGTGSSGKSVSAAEAYIYYANASKDIGFYLAKAGSIPANKAYIPAEELGASGARNFYGVNFDGAPSAVRHIESEAPASSGQYYNLQGQPVAHPTRGLYILNGRKVVVK